MPHLNSTTINSDCFKQSSVLFTDLGILDYDSARVVQESAVANRKLGKIQDTIYFTEHPSTITVGIRGLESQIKESKEQLATRGVTLRQVRRGGEVTIHMKGQLIVYPVVSLRDRKLGVRDFAVTLLQVGANILSDYGLEAEVREKPAGVFVNGKKLIALGLQICHGVTNHGLAINIANQLDLYSLIVPCGRSDISVSSLSQELGHSTQISDVSKRFEKRFVEYFEVAVHRGN